MLAVPPSGRETKRRFSFQLPPSEAPPQCEPEGRTQFRDQAHTPGDGGDGKPGKPGRPSKPSPPGYSLRETEPPAVRPTEGYLQTSPPSADAFGVEPLGAKPFPCQEEVPRVGGFERTGSRRFVQRNPPRLELFPKGKPSLELSPFPNTPHRPKGRVAKEGTRENHRFDRERHNPARGLTRQVPGCRRSPGQTLGGEPRKERGPAGTEGKPGKPG